MSSIVNNFAENSVTMNAGSTMNGDVHIENVNQGKDEGSTTETTNDSEQKQLKSPLRLFNIDLSGYSNDLSNSMSSSVAYEKQSRIFDELKRKNEEIFNSK